MSRFQDPYLAESAGFATGHSNGIAQGVNIGRQQGFSDGYTEGWNAAAKEANNQISQKDKIIAAKINEIHELNKKLNQQNNSADRLINELNIDREELSQLILSLSERVKSLLEKNKILEAKIEEINLSQQKSRGNIETEQEQQNKPFMGVLSIARSAMKVVASASVEEQSTFVDNYAELATELQTHSYIKEHKFPHNQEAIHPHIPDICQILEDTVFPQVRKYRSQKNEKSNN